MYFNELTTDLAALPDPLINNILAQCQTISIRYDDRFYFGVNTMGVNNAGMPGPLKAAMWPALKYIADQKFPCLTGLTAFQIGICNIKSQWPAQIQLPTKFLYSISEQIVVPLLADATVSLGNTYKIIEAGRIYRFNNRVQSTIVQSPDFLAMVIIYLNKDLYGNLTDEELNADCARLSSEVILE